MTTNCDLRNTALLLGISLSLFAACSSDDRRAGSAEGTSPHIVDQAASQCILADPGRAIGAGIDAPSLNPDYGDYVAEDDGACSQSDEFRFGMGRSDVTGVIADTASPAWVNPLQVFDSLHTRVYARAFAIESACNGKRVMFVSIDTGLMSAALRNAILAEIAADAELQGSYDGANVMLSVTHTHSDPNTGVVSSNNGLQVLTLGTVDAIRRAHRSLQTQQSSGQLRLAKGELLNTSINRSKPAYANNPEAERLAFLNIDGAESQVDKSMIQLEMLRGDNSIASLINWYGIHPTVIGPSQSTVSGDNKGVAALGMEALFDADYAAAPGEDNFVAAFAQAVEGDASPNIFIEDFPHPDPRRGGGVDDFDSNRISALKQLARSIELLGRGEIVIGPVDYRLVWVPINAITVTDPQVLASLNHPSVMDTEPKRTCDGILGVSFGAGAEDGPGPTVEGLSCDSDQSLLDAAAQDISTLANARLEGFPGGWPAQTIPGQLLSAAVFCNVAALPPLLGDFSCQGNKPVLLPRGAAELPFQLFQIGNLGLLGLPWEVTTMAARRLRDTLMPELSRAGIDTLVIAGLVNDYVHYLTTREEYESQQYEGASTLYGPWTLAAVQQESLNLARALVNEEEEPKPRDPGPRADLALVAGPIEAPHPAGAPGTVLAQPADSIQGDVVVFSIVAGHPGNDLQLNGSYVDVERQNAAGDWEIVSTDKNPELVYRWNATQLPVAIELPVSSFGAGEARWTIPANTPDGTYRMVMRGVSRSNLMAQPQAYEVTSNSFDVEGGFEVCP